MAKANKLHIAANVSTELPEAAHMGLRLGLDNIQLVQINWKQGFVKLQVGTLIIHDHRQGIVKAWQKAMHWTKERMETAIKHHSKTFFNWSNELDLQASKELEYSLNRAEVYMDRATDSYLVSHEALEQFYSTDWRIPDPIALVDARVNRKGMPYVIIKDATTDEADEFLSVVFDDDSKPWGVCFHYYYGRGGWNHNLILHGKGTDMTEMY